MSRCKKCKEFIFLWEVWDENCGDDCRNVFAVDAEEAGEKYGEINDPDNDYCLADCGTIDVKIRKRGEKGWETYRLSAEPTVNYRASKVEEDEVPE